MAAVAVSLATKNVEGLLSNLVNKAYAAISGEVALLIRVREDIEYIKDELEIMSAFIGSAEEKQDSNKAARAWVKQVRELAYAVEDCVEEFSVHLSRKSKHNLVTRLARSLRSLRGRHRIAVQIASIKSKALEVSQRRVRYGINNDESSTGRSAAFQGIGQYDPRIATTFNEDDYSIKTALFGYLLDRGNIPLRILAVSGPADLGKSTIVRKAYDSAEVASGYFSLRAWVDVSEDPYSSMEQLLTEVIRQILPSRPKYLKEMGKEQLIEVVKDKLKDERYVIVFDNVRDVHQWESLRVILPDNQKGSRVIVTTESAELVQTFKDLGVIFDMASTLLTQESNNLFSRRVFGGELCPKELKTSIRGFIKLCVGHPLAIMIVASLLAYEPKTTDCWNNMLNLLGSLLKEQDSKGTITRTLSLSFNHLPYDVKRCFLYLTRFPGQCLIPRKRILRLWIAEGLVAARRNMGVEEVAESFFNELVNLCMILPTVFSANSKVKSFRLHDVDVMLGLILSNSMEDNFLSLLGNRSNWMPQDVIRRLSIDTDHDAEILTLSRVRSLSMTGNGCPSLISPTLRLLRVLDLEDCHALHDSHLKTVGKFLHLKYLSLRNTKVSRLPNSLGDLQNLETLDIRRSSIRRLPSGITKLQRLRVLRCGNNLEMRVENVTVPRGMGKLRNLEELEVVNVEKNSDRIAKELEKLSQLRKLAVSCLPRECGSTFCDSLIKIISSLHSLKVHSHPSLAFLSELNCPTAPLLQSLRLEGQLSGVLPNLVTSLVNLRKVFLSESELGNDAVQALGSLPNLIQLTLENNAYIEERLTVPAQGFCSLKVLSLAHLPLKSLQADKDAMPRLGLVYLTGIVDLIEDIRIRLERHPNNPRLIVGNVS